MIIHDIMRKPNLIIVLLYIFHSKQFGIFVLDQNFQFLFGNGGESLSHICKSLTALHGRGAWKLGGL